MAFFDLPLDQLETYAPPRAEPADFDAFWADTLKQSRAHPLNAQFVPVDTGYRTVEVFDLTFNGYAGQPIKGWLVLPKDRPAKVPCVVEYIGYGGGRGLPISWLQWASAGYAHLVMDTRGQGSTWSNGDTPDLETEAGNPHHPGFMTRGILDRATYYYRRVFTDACRAVETAQSHPAIDPDRIAVTGGSQGGGIAIAASGLMPAVKVSMPDVPYLCHYRRAMQITDAYPYQEIVRYLKVHRNKVDAVYTTLQYFDGVNFSARSKAKALFSVGLMDEICPPSTVYAAYNQWAGAKQIKIYEYNHHEGGEQFHAQEKIRFLRGVWPM